MPGCPRAAADWVKSRVKQVVLIKARVQEVSNNQTGREELKASIILRQGNTPHYLAALFRRHLTLELKFTKESLEGLRPLGQILKNSTDP